MCVEFLRISLDFLAERLGGVPNDWKLKKIPALAVIHLHFLIVYSKVKKNGPPPPQKKGR